jgi:cytosine/adenosine deaminase-related metal-dependent hydrolase
MATINGARCAGMADSLGSIEAGKDADVVLFDTTFPEWQPLYNPVSNLVYSATGNSVRDVFVAGERVVADGHLTQIEEGEILRLVRAATERIGRRLDIGKLSKLRWPIV